MSKMKYVPALVAIGLLFGGVAAANTTAYSHDFADDVGDWQGAIAHDNTDETGEVTGSTYSFFGGAVNQAVWPSHGYLTELAVYLDPATLAAGDGFDLTVASYNQSGTHLRDFIFHVGMTAAGDLLVNGSNNTDGAVNEYKLFNDGDGTPTTITTAGWYTFQHVFHDAGDGSLAVDLRVLDDTGTEVFVTTRNNVADDLATTVGGVGYQWFTFASGTFDVDNQLLEFVTIGPASKDDCKNGGFESFGYDNQGQCVASVQANEAAGK